jgi:hypothetical protein
MGGVVAAPSRDAAPAEAHLVVKEMMLALQKLVLYAHYGISMPAAALARGTQCGECDGDVGGDGSRPHRRRWLVALGAVADGTVGTPRTAGGD